MMKRTASLCGSRVYAWMNICTPRDINEENMNQELDKLEQELEQEAQQTQ
jgi:hypothetical protein